MLKDLKHPFAGGEPVHDVTFENVQAGLRTDLLFRLANMNGALVVGTGDSVGAWPRLVHLRRRRPYEPLQSQRRGVEDADPAPDPLRRAFRRVQRGGVAGVCIRCWRAEISPELVPAGADGKVQSTEAMVGPYALQDFNLYYLTRYGFAPSKIAFLAHTAWSDTAAGAWPDDIALADRRAYDLPEIKKWLRLFITRFFANQFKRSALPNGPKLSSGGSLSPRGDWRMPSDASPAAWLAELEANVPD